VVLILVATTCMASTVFATFPGANGRIAYTDYGGITIIHTIQPDGTDRTSLTTGFDPSWSANGRWLTFARRVDHKTDIFMIRDDGSAERRLTDTPRCEHDPSFAPGGRRVLYTSSTGGTCLGGGYGELASGSIVTIQTDGSTRRRLRRGLSFARPVFSPDGKHVAYTRGDEIRVMRSNGTHSRILYEDRYLDGGRAFLDYSPDGRHIVFNRGTPGDVRRPLQPREMGSDGSHPGPACTPGPFQPVFAPGGEGFAASGHVGPLEDFSTDILVGDCNQNRRLTNYWAVGGNAESPSWQPLPGG